MRADQLGDRDPERLPAQTALPAGRIHTTSKDPAEATQQEVSHRSGRARMSVGALKVALAVGIGDDHRLMFHSLTAPTPLAGGRTGSTWPRWPIPGCPAIRPDHVYFDPAFHQPLDKGYEVRIAAQEHHNIYLILRRRLPHIEGDHGIDVRFACAIGSLAQGPYNHTVEAGLFKGDELLTLLLPAPL